MKRYDEESTYEVQGRFGSHYSIAFAEDLAVFALEAAVTIEDITGGHPEKALLFYRGMSGIAMATAIVMAQMMSGSKKSKQAYIRKDEEISHGSKVETSADLSSIEYCIFVDDFICSGHTLRVAYAALQKQGWIKLPKRIYVITQSSGGGTEILEDHTVYKEDWYSLW